jgi:hypothetical protein
MCVAERWKGKEQKEDKKKMQAMQASRNFLLGIAPARRTHEQRPFKLALMLFFFPSAQAP